MRQFRKPPGPHPAAGKNLDLAAAGKRRQAVVYKEGYICYGMVPDPTAMLRHQMKLKQQENTR